MSSQRFQRIKIAASPDSDCVSSSVFCSSSNHGCRSLRCKTASATKSASGSPNRGERSTRANDKSCVGDTSTSSRAVMSCTSQQSIRSVFSPICAGTCSACSACCTGSKPARLRDSTMMSAGFTPLATCRAIQAAAWRASRLRRVSSCNWRGVVRLSRHSAFGSAASASSADSARGIAGNRPRLPVWPEAVVCGRKPS